MHYDVWDTDINKYLGRFTDDADVFSMIGTLIDEYGPDYAECLSVGRVSGDGTILPPITGDELLARISVRHPEQEPEGDRPGSLIAVPNRAYQKSKMIAAKPFKRG
jgi:hypothetical protein